MKKCKTCKIELPLDLFNKFKGSKDGLRYSCKECSNKLNKEYQDNNKEKIKLRRHKHYVENKEALNEITREYHRNNKEKLAIYYNNRKDEYREYRKQYKKNRKQTDPLYSLSERIRKSILNSFSKVSYKKNTKTTQIIGCSFYELKMHLESKFESWMTWENRGKYNGEFNFGWDIDHIIPIASAKTIEELINLLHYTNLQPLCSKFNRDVKKDNIL